MNATADNQFMVRASGGTIFYSAADLSTGVSLAPGSGSWASVSDRTKKANFRREDGDVALRAIARLPIESWNYKAQAPAIRHLGPMAQDFFEAFHLGEGNTTITGVDIDGVNLLAIQALEKRTAKIEAQATELKTLRARIAELETLVAPLRKNGTLAKRR